MGVRPPDRRAPVRNPEGVDGKHSLSDQDAWKGQNGNEPTRAGLQHEANDPDPRCQATDGGYRHMIARLSARLCRTRTGGRHNIHPEKPVSHALGGKRTFRPIVV